MDFIAGALGKLLYFIYKTIAFESYGLAIIFFTIVVKLCLLPLTIKQLRSTNKMQELQPKIQEIQKRYKNDKEKMNQEMMKLYQEEKYNPASGCFPILIQMPILFGLFYAIRKPMSHMLSLSKDIIGQTIVRIQQATSFIDLEKLNILDSFNKFVAENDFPSIVNLISKKDFYYEVKIMNEINNNTNLSDGSFETLKLTFLKIFNLGAKPTYQINKILEEPGLYVPLFILVIVAAATTFISTRLSFNQTSKNSTQNQPANNIGKNMMYISPLFTLWIGFAAPAGLSLYWTVSNLFQLVQQIYVNKVVIKNKEE